MEKDLKGLRAVVVEDDDEYLQRITKVLEKQGMTVFGFSDGESMRSGLSGVFPDIFILDVMMSGENGYEICERLKTWSMYIDTPVILLTAVADHVSSTKYSHSSGKETNADDYVPKDANAMENVIASIRRLTKK